MNTLIVVFGVVIVVGMVVPRQNVVHLQNE